MLAHDFIGNPTRSAWAEIRLDALIRNITTVRSLLKPGTHCMAVVKANGYGHGAVKSSQIFLQYGADMLGVALLQEALELRAAGISAPILVLTPPMPEEADNYIANDIEFTLCTRTIAERFSVRASALGKSAIAHVKIDTGMGRVGIQPANAREFVNAVASLPNLVLRGIATHYASSDEDIPYTKAQLETFLAVISALEESGYRFPLQHSANSGAVINLPESHLNCVRPGIILYGYAPLKTTEIMLEPALALKTKIDYVKRVPAGTSISYGRKYYTDSETTIATAPIGYADGYMRALSGKSYAIASGKKFPVVGRICMDQIMIDTGDAPVREGDVVTLLGADGESTISAYDLAAAAGTIPWEILTNISARVPRIFV